MPKPVASKSPAKPTKTRPGAVKRRRARATARAVIQRSNPAGGGWADLAGMAKQVGAGAAGYAGTRVIQRIAWTVTQKRRPTWGKHAQALAGVATFGALLYGASKVQALGDYHEAIVIGSGVAAAQGVVQAYVPKYAWLLQDPRSDAARQVAAGAPAAQLPEPQDGDDLLEQQIQQMERMPQRQQRRSPVAQALQTAAVASGDPGGELDESLLEELGTEDVDDLYAGTFENPTLFAN